MNTLGILVLVVVVILCLMLYDVYLRYKQHKREDGCDDQKRYYDKHNQHKWNTSKLKVNKNLFKGKK